MATSRWSLIIGFLVLFLVIVVAPVTEREAPRRETLLETVEPRGQEAVGPRRLPLERERNEPLLRSESSSSADGEAPIGRPVRIRGQALRGIDPLIGVELLFRGKGQTNREPNSVTTNASGRFELLLTEGEYEASSRDPYLRARDDRVSASLATESREITLHFEAAGQILGRVVDVEGAGVSGANVKAELSILFNDFDPYSDPIGFESIEATTDRSGRYELRHLEGASWLTLSSEVTGRGRGRVDLVGVSVEQTTAAPDLVLRKGRSLAVQVVGESGVSIQGARVECLESEPERHPVFEMAFRQIASADERGRVIFDFLEADRLELRVTHESWAPRTVAVEGRVSDATVTLSEGQVVLGQLLGHTGDEPPRVLMKPLSVEPWVLSPRPLPAEVDAEGGCRWRHVAAGAYVVEAEGYRSLEIDVPLDEAFRLSRATRRIEGQILGPDGAPYPEQCQLELIPTGFLAVDSDPPFRKSLFTERFSFEVPIGSYTLVATDQRRGLIGRVSLRVPARNEAPAFDIRLRSSGFAIEGVVVDESDGQGISGAEVWIESPRRAVITDQEGRFQLPVLTADRYALEWRLLRVDRFVASTEPTFVIVSPVVRRPRVRLSTLGRASVSGRVLLPEGERLRGEVEVYSLSAILGAGGVDEDGRYRFESLPAGRHALLCDVGGEIEATRRIDLAVGQSAIVDFDLDTATASLSGRVLRDDLPLQHVEIRLYWSPEVLDQLASVVRTDPAGRFEMRDLKPGQQRFVIELLGADRTQSYERVLTLLERERQTIETSFRTVRVVFRARREAGELYLDGVVALRGAAGDLGEASIRVELNQPIRVPPGEYALLLSGVDTQRVAPGSVELREDGEIEIPLVPGERLDVIAVRLDGIRERAPFLAFESGRTVGRAGPFLPPGRFEVWMGGGDLTLQRVPAVEIQPGSRTLLEIPVVAPGWLEIGRGRTSGQVPRALLDDHGHDLTPLVGRRPSFELEAGVYRVVQFNGEISTVIVSSGESTILDVK